ncbi:hypothetical protein GM415_15045 [Pseudodesulfovibrio cashew]|uniref:Uncharacterized protein n=1 Tax=Pseudodesulfovibrio cashew TaxID=2678688 RepID=A0A6I6JMI2_9BACT|nr:hypothetical protein [Pseudodesulfovibrio cashew]QGY41383.1 hypothetical protein GM415_15045 [Pseudodesulfovibrio cashew]
MTLAIDSSLPTTSIARPARGLTKSIGFDTLTMEPEKTEEEKQRESATLSFQKELTPEEENRVVYLQNLLSQLLVMADGQPTDEQKTRIRDVEKELAEITGVKMRSSLSSMTRKLPKTGKDENEEEKDAERMANGIDPKEAAHKREIKTGQSTNPGMQLLRKNAFMTNLSSSLASFEKLSDIAI